MEGKMEGKIAGLLGFVAGIIIGLNMPQIKKFLKPYVKPHIKNFLDPFIKEIFIESIAPKIGVGEKAISEITKEMKEKEISEKKVSELSKEEVSEIIKTMETVIKPSDEPWKKFKSIKYVGQKEAKKIFELGFKSKKEFLSQPKEKIIEVLGPIGEKVCERYKK